MSSSTIIGDERNIFRLSDGTSHILRMRKISEPVWVKVIPVFHSTVSRQPQQFQLKLWSKQKGEGPYSILCAGHILCAIADLALRKVTEARCCAFYQSPGRKLYTNLTVSMSPQIVYY